MFPELKWYYVVVAYILAPSLSFCNAYGTGLTDMNMAYNYGKVALFVLASLAGDNSGVVAGLVGCGLIKSMVFISSDLMQDLKTGHLTLTSPRSMVVSQAIGTAIGCVVAPLTFFLFYKAFDVGNPNSEYKAPYALVYRNMAILGIQGFCALPRHCLHLCYAFFSFALVANLTRVGPAPYGDGGPIPSRGILCNRHVCGHPIRVCVAQARQPQCGTYDPCCGIRVDMWRWLVESPFVDACLLFA